MTVPQRLPSIISRKSLKRREVESAGAARPSSDVRARLSQWGLVAPV